MSCSPAELHLGSLRFPVSATSHIHETQRFKKTKKLRLTGAYSFPIYILKRAYALSPCKNDVCTPFHIVQVFLQSLKNFSVL